MTNRQRQDWFNKKKYLESEKQGVDLSGLMVVCGYCKVRSGVTCMASQKEIDDNCLCANAYNRFHKMRNK